jgi:uncharacterized repeat protein (TIGR01451 family)
MRRRIFLVLLTGLAIAAMIPGCTPAAEPTEPVQPGTVAQVPQQTPEPQLTTSKPGPPATPAPPAGPTPAPPATTTTTATPPAPPTPLTTLAPLEEVSPLTVLSVVGGEILVKRAGEERWQPADTGITLQPGDTIKAGRSSKAEITFFEGSTIELDASAEILVSQISVSATGSTKISLKQQLGRTVSRVQKLTDTASSYEIETPAAIAAVRGSVMIINVAANGRTEVANEHGDIRIRVDGREYLVHEGMKRFIVPGQPPSDEVPMYSTGGGGGGGAPPPPALQMRMEVIFLAEPLAARVGDNITYTCQLSNTGDLAFHEVWVSTDVSGNATFQAGDDDGNAALDPGETWVFTSVYVLQEGDPSPLIATATVSAITSTFVAVVDTETVATSTVAEPGIGLVKAADPASVHVGDTVTYRYTVTNTGNTPLADISVVDDRLGTVPLVSGDFNADGWLDMAEIWVFSASHTAGAGDPDPLVNTAVASGTDNLSRTVTASDTASVAIFKPGIAIDKTANRSSTHVGDTVTYTCTVTNSGDTPLSGVSVTDNKLGAVPFVSGDTNTNSLLDTGETWVFRATYVVKTGDTNPLMNTAVASGIDNLSRTVTASDTVSVAILRPGITLDKTASPAFVHVGDTITYNYTVTNSGNTPLSGVSVTDDRLGTVPFVSGDSNTNGSLNTGEAWMFRAIYIAKSNDPSPLVNNAVASGTDSLSRTVSASDTAVVAILRPGIALDKTASPASVHVGDNITYTYAVTNTGNTPLSGVSVTDDRLGAVPFIGGDTNTNGILDTGETWIFRAMYLVKTNDPNPLVNNAVASGTDNLSRTVTATDTASVAVLKPGITLVKTADRAAAHADDTITYTYAVTNTGNTPLSGVSVSDDRLGSFIYGDSPLDAGEIWVFSAGYTAGAEDPNPLVNTAVASGTDNLSRTVTATDTASVAVLRPGIALDKTADRPSAHVNDTIIYMYTVTNTGNAPLSGVSVIDDRLGTIAFASGDGNGDGRLGVAEVWVFSAGYSVSSEDPGQLVNTAIASGADSLARAVTASDTVSVAIFRPGIALNAVASRLSAFVGDTIIYTYEVTNTGDTPVSGISVVDDRLGIVPFLSGDTDANGLLDAGEFWKFRTTYVVEADDPDPLVNNAVASGTDIMFGTVTASDTVSVVINR